MAIVLLLCLINFCAPLIHTAGTSRIAMITTRTIGGTPLTPTSPLWVAT